MAKKDESREISNAIIYNLMQTHREESNASDEKFSNKLDTFSEVMNTISNQISEMREKERNQDASIKRLEDDFSILNTKIENTTLLVEKSISYSKGVAYASGALVATMIAVVLIFGKTYIEYNTQKVVNAGISDALSKFDFYQINQ